MNTMIRQLTFIQNSKVHDRAVIGAFCQIGAPAEKVGVWPDSPFGVVIEENAVLHGLVTVDAGTWRDTLIKNGAWLMKKVHIGHDAVIGERVTIAPMVSIGGHVEIGEGANIGMGAMIHPKQKIPPYCMIGMGAIVTKGLHMQPFGVYAGNPAKFIKINKIGIEKSGLSKEQIDWIKADWEIKNNLP